MLLQKGIEAFFPTFNHYCIFTTIQRKYYICFKVQF